MRWNRPTDILPRTGSRFDAGLLGQRRRRSLCRVPVDQLLQLLAGLEVGDAPGRHVHPVAGPGVGGRGAVSRRRRRKLPKPRSSTFSPCCSAAAMLPNTVSTMISARFFVRPVASATCSTSAAFVRLPSVTGWSIVGSIRRRASPAGDNFVRSNDSSGRTVGSPATGTTAPPREEATPLARPRPRTGNAGRPGQSASSAGDTRAWTLTVRRSAISAPGGWSGSGAVAHSPASRTQATRQWGFEGGGYSHSPALVYTRGMLAMTPNGCHSQPPCLLICRPSVSLHRPELRRRPPGSSRPPVFSLVSFPRSNLCPAPHVLPCRRSRPDQLRGRCARSGEAGCGSVMVTGRRFWRLLVPQAP